MKKDIKDYLHLYVGEADVKYEDSDLIYNLTLSELSVAISVSEEVKLLLRPLSDATDEEKIGAAFSDGARDKFGRLLHYRGRNNGDYTPEQVRYLLSKGFDLFNLIPEGLAIDKTTLKQKV